MPRILVVDYSRSGNTRKLARAIAHACGADLEDIHDEDSRRGLWGWIRSCKEAMRAFPAAIQPVERDPADYDLVVLGSPVWVGHVSSPMRSYLARHSGKLGHVALFVTEGGSGGPKALAEMTALVGQKPAATLELRAGELGNDLESKIGGFVQTIQGAATIATGAVSAS